MKFLPLIALLFVPFSAYAQNDVEIVKIKDGIHMLISPQGGNVAVSSGLDGTFIIDDQLDGRSKIIKNAIKTITDQDTKFILNTHYHFDHTGGNESFGEDGAIIVAHDAVRERLSTKQFITYFKKEMQPLSKAGLPVVTFSKDMNLHYNNDDIQIIHVESAHTDGDAIAYFKNDNVIVTGDTVFNGMYPFIDAEHGGSLKGLLAAQATMLEIADEDTAIIPGHGALMNKADLQAYHDMLTTISGRIETSIKDGKTLEETLDAKPSAEFDEKMGHGIVGPEAFVSFLYKHLSQSVHE